MIFWIFSDYFFALLYVIMCQNLITQPRAKALKSRILYSLNGIKCFWKSCVKLSVPGHAFQVDPCE